MGYDFGRRWAIKRWYDGRKWTASVGYVRPIHKKFFFINQTNSIADNKMMSKFIHVAFFYKFKYKIYYIGSPEIFQNMIFFNSCGEPFKFIKRLYCVKIIYCSVKITNKRSLISDLQRKSDPFDFIPI